MALISLRNLCISFGTPTLLNKVNLQLEKGERVCLLGRNGEGKTTLMKIIAGDVEPDSGEIVRLPGLRVGFLSQKVPNNLSGTAFDVITTGLGNIGKLLTEYHEISSRLTDDESKSLMGQLDEIQHALEANDGWQIHKSVEKIISRMELDADVKFEDMSAGMKRRVLLAKSLVLEPDLLLLDEPTNHLDIVAINWLEEFLLKFKSTLLFVTHDRMFLKRLATRIIELDRGNLSDWSCDYETFRNRKQAVLDAEEKQWELFDKKLASEEIWIRQGIKARRTRNEGRVEALKKMRELRKARRERTGSANINLQDAERTGQKVVFAENVSYGYDNRVIIQNFTATIMRGDKVGLIGPNGIGKTTLLNILLGNLKPKQGRVILGSRLQVAYFDQLRSQLNEKESVKYNVSDGYDTLTINGKPRHVIGYLQDFLFTPNRSHSPVCHLSGGERNRLLLARLFSKPSNVLVMDEPTNDLDAETLELLEELLINYDGTLLLVSHDRAFLNNVATSILSFEGKGVVKEYVGGYDDWLRQQELDLPIEIKKIAKKSKKPKKIHTRPARPRKLSFNEKQELESLPNQIEILENKKSELHEIMVDPDFYRKEGGKIVEVTKKLESIEGKLNNAYKRWEDLESLLQRLSVEKYEL